MKELWGIIKRARPSQLLELVTLCLSNALMVRPTYRATKQAIELADIHFGFSHRKNTPANAFRHGIWNWLIAKECSRRTTDVEKVLNWTEKITAMHEKILPGSALANAMDLHNNAVGRWHFRKDDKRELQGSVELFLDLARTSLLAKTLEEIQATSQTKFVHLIQLK